MKLRGKCPLPRVTAAFGVGPDDKHITTVDAGGVALAAIQGLNQKLEKRTRRSTNWKSGWRR
jgi:hypothetical protein